MQRFNNRMALVAGVFTLSLTTAATALAAAFDFNGAPDNQRDDLGYYYVITGGKFPTGTTPNGDNASGGTFRFLLDDPGYGYPINAWQKDDWFPQNAGLALTIRNGGSIVYDNNGLEDGSYGSFYTEGGNNAGLYRGYSMTNNYDWIYATYFKLTEQTTITQITGYFDANGGTSDPVAFNPFSPDISYLMNFWGASCVDDGPRRVCDPTATSFLGDVFTSYGNGGSFAVSDTGVDRVFNSGVHDDIYRLTYTLDTPIVLGPGEYFFSHSAVIEATEPGTLALLGAALAGLGLARRRRS